MNTQYFKERLLKEERELLSRIERAEASARETRDDGVRDPGDESA